ncbi:MAG: ABC transporter ATP-binding protein, partial [Chlorobiales bacterium]|nr:ABC transporter ATP-binding protein [Chlorobiales bacterium]
IARFMSIVLTERILVGNLSVYALVALGRYPYTGWLGKLSAEDEAIVREAIEVTGVQEFADRHVSELSDGERQKVMIARALAQDTPIILLDEPTAHLDLPNRIEIVRLLRRLSREKEKAILMSTHELDLALQAADKIWLMQQNKGNLANGYEGKSTMLTGIPEDLVLSGEFEAVFRQGGFEFDRHTGSFKIHNPVYGPIGLVGNGPHAHWTKRALEREGFLVAVDDGESGIVELVEDGQTCKWIYHMKGHSSPKELNSVAELIHALRSIKYQG